MHPSIEFKPIMSVPKKDEFYQFRPEHPMYAPKKIGEIYFLKAKDWITTIRGVVKNQFEKTRAEIAGSARHFTIYELN
jgi:hypothetical protein